jgi:hypothetical protein
VAQDRGSPCNGYGGGSWLSGVEGFPAMALGRTAMVAGEDPFPPRNRANARQEETHQ